MAAPGYPVFVTGLRLLPLTFLVLKEPIKEGNNLLHGINTEVFVVKDEAD